MRRAPQHSLLSTVPISGRTSCSPRKYQLPLRVRESQPNEDAAAYRQKMRAELCDDASSAHDDSDASDQSATDSVESFDTDTELTEVWTGSPPPQHAQLESCDSVASCGPRPSSPNALPPQERTAPTYDGSDTSDQSATDSVESCDTDTDLTEVWTGSPPPEQAQLESCGPRTNLLEALPPQERTDRTLQSPGSVRYCFPQLVEAKNLQLPKPPWYSGENVLKLLLLISCLLVLAFVLTLVWEPATAVTDRRRRVLSYLVRGCTSDTF